MRSCSSCGTLVPGRVCPHCGERPRTFRLHATAVAVLGLSFATVSAGCTQALYGVVDTVEPAVDMDRDGYGEDDCDDNNADIYPGAEETAGDGVDSNCDGEDDPQA